MYRRLCWTRSKIALLVVGIVLLGITVYSFHRYNKSREQAEAARIAAIRAQRSYFNWAERTQYVVTPIF